MGFGIPGAHLDGLVPTSKIQVRTINGQKDKRNLRFSAFAVIYLDDVLVPNGGNYTVWPKSHRFFEAYFLKEGLSNVYAPLPEIDLPEGPHPITGKAGDVIFAHTMIAHRGGINTSPDIRYAAIFRASHIKVREFGVESFTDIWKEWDGIREAVEPEEKNHVI